MYVLAHLSDPHLAPLPFPSPVTLFNKRFFGALSWYVRKKPIHLAPVLDALVADMRRAAPDHIVVTGDLTNIALPAEFERARRWLERLGAPDRVSVIPGNHDAYVPIAWQQSFAQWADYMSGADPDGDEKDEKPALSEACFPFVRRRGPLAILGLSSAAPMPLLGTPAAGRLGARQLEKLGRHLARLRDEDVFRVVLIHHPPYEGVSPRKCLFDAAQLCGILAEAGAELVLYGHLHEPGFAELPTPKGPIPMIGLPSASACRHKATAAARYHIYRLSRGGGEWELEVEAREVASTHNRFHTVERHVLNVKRGGAAAERGLDAPEEVFS
jgi:3',5'-cyclic AMP phosphodiesterase CpdA